MNNSSKDRLWRIRLIVTLLIGGVMGLLFWPAFQPKRDRLYHLTGAYLSRAVKSVHMYHSDHGSLPRSGTPNLSWRYSLLPYFDYETLHAKFDPKQAWNGQNNIKLLRPAAKCYWSQSLDKEEWEKGMTCFQAITGPDTAWEREGLQFPNDFPDGLNNTILIAEARDPVPWTKPADMVYEPDGPLPRFGNRSIIGSSFLGLRNKYGFGVGFADGSVRFFSKDTDENVLRALITRNGGEQILDE